MPKTPIDRLDDQIKEILEEYSDDIAGGVEKAAKAVAKKGANAIKARASSMFGGTGSYASGWKVDEKKSRLYVMETIYNSTKPGLAHLLEHGHAKVDGGRVAGRPHIKPVEEEITKEFEEKVVDVIKGN